MPHVSISNVTENVSLVLLFLTIMTVSLPCIAALKHPRTPPSNPSVDFPSGDSEHVAKRARPMGITDEVVRFGLLLTQLCNYITGPFFQLLILQLFSPCSVDS